VDTPLFETKQALK